MSYRPAGPIPSVEMSKGAIGAALQGFGTVVADYMHKEERIADETAVNDANNKRESARLEYMAGEDGFVHKKGENAGPEMITEYRKRYQDTINEIGGALANERQKSNFQKYSQVSTLGYEQSILRHVTGEGERHRKQVFATGLEVNQRRAAAGWQDPTAIATTLTDSYRLIEQRGESEGWKQPTIDLAKVNASSAIHSGVLDQMLAANQDITAQKYFADVKKAGQLTLEAQKKYGTQLEATSTANEALRGVDAEWLANGPKGQNDPIKIAQMDENLREKYGDDPKVLEAARAELRARASLHNSEQAEINNSNKASVLEAYSKGMTPAEIIKLPAFNALEGTQQEEIRNYMEDRGYTEKQRARSDATYETGAKSRDAYAAFLVYSSPSVLIWLKDSEIRAMLPALGPKLTADLLTMRAQLDSPDKVRAATLDDDQFKALATDAGLDAYAKKPQKERLGRLKNHIEAIIDQEQAKAKRSLTREEKGKLMQIEIDKKVMLDVWGTDPSIPAGSVSAAEREKVYVDIESVPQQFQGHAINYLRSIGKIPQDMSDAEGVRRYRSEIQRAYGARLIGGSKKEILGIFGTGQPRTRRSSFEIERDLRLTDQEENIIDYHRDSVQSGRTGKDEQGRAISVWALGIKVPSGPHKGEFVAVPGWVNGKQLNEEQAWRHWRDEVNAGKWPLYDSGEALNRRARQMHQIMEVR